MNGKLRLVLDTAYITHIEIKSFQSCGFQMTWLGVICGMKEGTGWGATRALFAALDVDWPRVGGALAKLGGGKHKIDLNWHNFKSDNSPLPRVKDRLCDCSWQNHIGRRGMGSLSASCLLSGLKHSMLPFPNCLGRVVPRAAATALGAELVENLDEVAMLTLIV